MTDRIADFFAFARERHAVYLRRRAGLPGPWTEDPILAKYKFTNVFRELDRTTVWFREHVRDSLRESPDVLLATVVFRWFNRITTGEAIFSQDSALFPKDHHTAWDCRGWIGPDDGPVDWINDFLRPSILSYCGSGPYVTGAYIIKTPDGYNKLDGVLKCIEWFASQEHPARQGMIQRSDVGWQEIADLCLRHPGEISLYEIWYWLKAFPFLGDFMAYEIVTDLRHTALLNRAPDIMTWANPGPGAARGLGRIHSGNKDEFNQHRDKSGLITEMQTILELSQSKKYWPQIIHPDSITIGNDYELSVPLDQMLNWPSWEMREVEHTLCEFDKYERARTGEGRPRGTFRP